MNTAVLHYQHECEMERYRSVLRRPAIKTKRGWHILMKNHATSISATILTNSCFFLIITMCLIVPAYAADNAGALRVEALEVLEQQANYRCPGCGSVGYGSAFAYVVDQDGNPVPYALVLGEWSNSGTRREVSITNAYGWAPFFSEPVSFAGEDKPSFTFCINNIIKAGFVFDPAQGGLTCGTAD